MLSAADILSPGVVVHQDKIDSGISRWVAHASSWYEHGVCIHQLLQLSYLKRSSNSALIAGSWALLWRVMVKLTMFAHD